MIRAAVFARMLYMGKRVYFRVLRAPSRRLCIGFSGRLLIFYLLVPVEHHDAVALSAQKPTHLLFHLLMRAALVEMNFGADLQHIFRL